MNITARKDHDHVVIEIGNATITMPEEDARRLMNALNALNALNAVVPLTTNVFTIDWSRVPFGALGTAVVPCNYNNISTIGHRQ